MSICYLLDGETPPARKNGKSLPCVLLQAENAELRELVRDMWHDARLFDANGHIDGMRLSDSKSEDYKRRMEKLGVDV